MRDNVSVTVLAVAVLVLAASQYHQANQISALQKGSATFSAGSPDFSPKKVALPSEPISLDGAVVRGSPDATVALIEYADFQCPFCESFARNTLPEIERAYLDTGKIVLAFRNLPLQRIHPNAFRTAQAAACAARQGRFWEMHNSLFSALVLADNEELRRKGEHVGLDMKQFDLCINESVSPEVQKDLDSARALGLTATPTFFVGRIDRDKRVRVVSRLSGAVRTEKFDQAIEKALSQF
jgi:protein-disulfide isomerase